MAGPKRILKIFKPLFIKSEAINIPVHDSYTTAEMRTTEKFHIWEITT
jgi:hypothetical protein